MNSLQKIIDKLNFHQKYWLQKISQTASRKYNLKFIENFISEPVWVLALLLPVPDSFPSSSSPPWVVWVRASFRRFAFWLRSVLRPRSELRCEPPVLQPTRPWDALTHHAGAKLFPCPRSVHVPLHRLYNIYIESSWFYRLVLQEVNYESVMGRGKCVPIKCANYKCLVTNNLLLTTC